MFHFNNVHLGIAPIGWRNDDLPELGAENTFRQIVSEMALAGFAGCEAGGQFPSDPAVLKRELDLRHLRMASRWFSSFLLSQPLEAVTEQFCAALDTLSQLGAGCINVSEQTGSIQGEIHTPVFGGHKPVMTDAQWDTLCAGLNHLGGIAQARGFRLCYHHHMGTVVQSLAETERLLSSTIPGQVFLCYDTGHFVFAGEDALAFLERHVDRVGHVHLKDIRPAVVREARRQGWSFLQSVKNGAFTVPGDGAIDFDPVFQVLEAANYSGWLLVEAEQDPAKADPLAYALKAKAYLSARIQPAEVRA